MEPGLEIRKGEKLSCSNCHCLLPGVWGGSKERRVELGRFPDSAVVCSFEEALLLPLLIGCGNGEASHKAGRWEADQLEQKK